MLDHGSASIFKPSNDAAQFLGIKLDRKASRANKIAKQNREMPSLGLRVRRCNGCGRYARSRRKTLLIAGDSFKHPLAVAKRDCQLFEIRLGEVEQDVDVDDVLRKERDILREAEPREPPRDAIALGYSIYQEGGSVKPKFLRPSLSRLVAGNRGFYLVPAHQELAFPCHVRAAENSLSRFRSPAQQHPSQLLRRGPTPWNIPELRVR
jgi:hypothetical protein